MGGGTEAKQPHAFSLFYSRHSQRPEADDSGTQQRRRVEIIELSGNRKAEIGPGERVLGITAVDGVAGECRRITQVLHFAAAVGAGAVGAADPGDTDA